MNIDLCRVNLEDAQLLWEMQIKSFNNLFLKYQDYDTNPANEPIEKVINRLNKDNSFYYFIVADGVKVGAVRVLINGTIKRISPIFILPEYQNKGIAQKAISLCEEIYGKSNWQLETILQEKANCHVYEKLGYKPTGKTEQINDKMTLIYYEK